MWPFRKKKPIEAPEVPPVDFGELRRQQETFIAQQQADMKRRLDEQIARIDAMPITRFAWTPVMDGFGRILALAWRNDPETAHRLLYEPGQGWA